GGADAALRTPPALIEPRTLAAGRSHTCAIDRFGLQCWGAPGARNLAPRELTWPRQVAVGGGGSEAFACARHLQGITCWGDNSRAQTRYDGAPLHLLYRAEAEINAPPARVWQVLMDLPKYGAWNPYTTAMQSTLKIGDPMVMTVRMNAAVTLTQTEHIRVLEPGHKVCWGIETTTPEQNSGERCQWLEPLPGGGTRYVTEDLIEGTLNPLVTLLFDGDLKTGFAGVARGLKTYCEANPRP
ncbi:MAG TPA: SRPBCC domain-containing protein, partial [Polyangiales bacterium]